MGRRSQRLGGAETATRSPSPEQVRKDKKRKKSHKQRPDKENREEAFPIRDAVFTRRREDGSTSLAILNPGEGVIPGTEKDRPVSLGNYLGKVRYNIEERLTQTVHPIICRYAMGPPVSRDSRRTGEIRLSLCTRYSTLGDTVLMDQPLILPSLI